MLHTDNRRSEALFEKSEGAPTAVKLGAALVTSTAAASLAWLLYGVICVQIQAGEPFVIIFGFPPPLAFAGAYLWAKRTYSELTALAYGSTAAAASMLVILTLTFIPV
ncbi:MAG: hypothetical protein ACXWD3_18305 [Mycobacterium sp.]